MSEVLEKNIEQKLEEGMSSKNALLQEKTSIDEGDSIEKQKKEELIHALEKGFSYLKKQIDTKTPDMWYELRDGDFEDLNTLLTSDTKYIFTSMDGKQVEMGFKEMMDWLSMAHSRSLMALGNGTRSPEKYLEMTGKLIVFNIEKVEVDATGKITKIFEAAQ